MKKKKLFQIGALALLLSLASCRTYQCSSPLEVPYAALEEARADSVCNTLFTEEGWVSEQWWTLFDDPQLDEFIEITIERNPTLAEAYANIMLAMANADRVRAALYPYIWWGGDVGRQKLSETGIIPFNNTNIPVGPFIPIYFTQYETQLNLTYQFDFWGKNRNTLRAALGEVQAHVADMAFARLQLTSALAQVYFRLQIEYKRREIAMRLVENKRAALALISKRTLGGLGNNIAVHNAEIKLKDAQVTLLQIEGEIAVDEYQLKSYLAEDFEEVISDIVIEDRPLPQIPLPSDLPLRLIAHRPDIIAQLWLIDSAGKQIEVAKAGFYPDFNLTSFFGFQTIHFKEFFRWDSSYFNLDPAFTLPIFDAGRLCANLRGSSIDYDIAIFQYNELILNAVKEVLDGVAVLKNRQDQLEKYEDERSIVSENFKLTELRVANHIDSALNYLSSEESLLNAEDLESIALGEKLEALIALIKALGGGYDICSEAL